MAPGENVLLFDDHADHHGPSVATFMAKRGSKIEVVTPERKLLVEVGMTNFPHYLRDLYKSNAVITPDTRLTEVYQEGNKLIAVLVNEYSDVEEERVVDQVVIEHGTLPDDELYFELKPASKNLGEVDLRKLRDREPQETQNNPAGRFMLFRVGDAVACRNIHAAIYDSLRLCLAF